MWDDLGDLGDGNPLDSTEVYGCFPFTKHFWNIQLESDFANRNLVSFLQGYLWYQFQAKRNWFVQMVNVSRAKFTSPDMCLPFAFWHSMNRPVCPLHVNGKRPYISLEPACFHNNLVGDLESSQLSTPPPPPKKKIKVMETNQMTLHVK